MTSIIPTVNILRINKTILKYKVPIDGLFKVPTVELIQFKFPCK